MTDTVTQAPAAQPTERSSLAKDRLGVSAVMCFIATAATPMTVVAGVMTTGFATTGLIGIPVAFLAVGAMLLLFSVGYVAMARRVRNTGAFYAYISHLGRPVGVGAAWVALIAYNALQVGLYGLLGATAAPMLEQWFGLSVPWWAVAAGCWLVVAALGLQAVDVNGKVLAALLVTEVAIIVVLSVSNVLTPAGGALDFAALAPSELVGPGAGAILVLAVLGFIGFEAATVYAEESRNPRRTVPVATYTSVIALAVLYTFAAWAMTVAVGTDQIVATSQEQQTGVIFGLVGAQLGPTVVTIAEVLLITSIVAATVSFHHTVARYMFSLGREGVLPRALGRTSATSGAPRTASIVQSVIGAAVIGGYALGGLDPLVELFFYAGTAGGLGVLMLITTTAIAIVVFFARTPGRENAWRSRVAPVAAAVILLLVCTAGIVNMPQLLGTPPGSALPWVVPAVYVAAAVAGIAWGRELARCRPEVYQTIGLGAGAATEERSSTGGLR
ncbi:APC family permease [Ruania zhangjianzhongii]|uniref:APC family permease n=1 Tax=Ruania zhangjianzhongii TaxID=2603206 RepID=UPI0011C9E3BA|nr:APC family permease [Ruania zhangjianzhongii]